MVGGATHYSSIALLLLRCKPIHLGHEFDVLALFSRQPLNFGLAVTLKKPVPECQKGFEIFGRQSPSLAIPLTALSIAYGHGQIHFEVQCLPLLVGTNACAQA